MIQYFIKGEITNYGNYRYKFSSIRSLSDKCLINLCNFSLKSPLTSHKGLIDEIYIYEKDILIYKIECYKPQEIHIDEIIKLGLISKILPRNNLVIEIKFLSYIMFDKLSCKVPDLIVE